MRPSPSSSIDATATTVEAAAAQCCYSEDSGGSWKNTTTAKCFKEIVRSSFNIQYTKTGVGPLSSLDETELK